MKLKQALYNNSDKHIYIKNIAKSSSTALHTQTSTRRCVSKWKTGVGSVCTSRWSLLVRRRVKLLPLKKVEGGKERERSEVLLGVPGEGRGCWGSGLPAVNTAARDQGSSHSADLTGVGAICTSQQAL